MQRKAAESRGDWRWRSMRCYMLVVYSATLLLVGYYAGRARLHVHVSLGDNDRVRLASGLDSHREHGLLTLDNGAANVARVVDDARALAEDQKAPHPQLREGQIIDYVELEPSPIPKAPFVQEGDSSRIRVYDPKLAMLTPPVPTDFELQGTAIVTMATGDEAGRQVVALVQSLRDHHTRIPHIVVMLARGPLTNAEEIVSRKYLEALQRLGASWVVIDPLPDTPYTKDIPGGRGVSWGMALNKLVVFGMTQFRKILWLDSDILILQNVDHLILTPHFTGAFTIDCCNRNADPKPSGGMWVLEPSDARMEEILEMMRNPKPDAALTGQPSWMFGDMEIVLYRFGKITQQSQRREWPFSRDMRQGCVPGIRYLPVYEKMSDEELTREATMGFQRAKSLEPVGVLPEEEKAAQAAGQPIWHMLDPRYDGLVGNCECVSERDMPERYFSVHFSCLPITPYVHKPGRYEQEEEFLDHASNRMLKCMRLYYLTWYTTYLRAMNGERLGDKHWTGPDVVADDPAADQRAIDAREAAFQKALEEDQRRQKEHKHNHG